MEIFLLVFCLVLLGLVLFLGFLILGILRAMGHLSWRFEQLEATTPSRVGRSGLKLGKKAPGFTLPSVAAGDVALSDFAGRKLLLVFTQTGCGPCRGIVPGLNQLQEVGEAQVLVVNNGTLEDTRKWAAEVKARFPVLVQSEFTLSRRYEIVTTPFAFLVNEGGVITSKGIINDAAQIRYLLSAALDGKQGRHMEPGPSGTEAGESADLVSSSTQQEDAS